MSTVSLAEIFLPLRVGTFLTMLVLFRYRVIRQSNITYTNMISAEELLKKLSFPNLCIVILLSVGLAQYNYKDIGNT